MKLLTVDTIEQANEKILNHIKTWRKKIINVPLDEALDHMLAEDIYAGCDVPSFRRSTVDGYAVIAKNIMGAGEGVPVFLTLSGSVQMGKKCEISIADGECAYVPTGGMLPEGSDAVVMIENCETAGTIISINDAVSPGIGTVETGEDFQKGNLLLKSGKTIRPQEIGALCAAGITSVNIFAPLTLSVFSTGDELVEPDSVPEPGQIRDINTKLIKSLAVKSGYRIISARVFPDDEKKLETAVREAAALCDIVIISGGSSQGEKDFTERVINSIAKPGVFTHGLAVKPGKPSIFGWDENSKTLFAGLPGHPVSAMIIFTLLIKNLYNQYINKISTDSISDIANSSFITARISCNIPGSPGKTTCYPVILINENDITIAKPVFGKAGMISILTRADGYIKIDLNKEGLKKDEQVTVYLL
ncbi:MAG: molybdopterin molybdotransferase MoeA [Treponema sp.]|nr:molybdopterin molybdotransferase MoeA [Treponema sp.]